MSTLQLTDQQRAELRQLYVSLGRSPSPGEIREVARQPSSALHSLITWNTQEAADERQIEQCRNILASYVFIVETRDEDEIEARFFVSTPAISKYNRRLGHDTNYTDHETVASSPTLFDSVLSAAIGVARGAITRFGAFPPIGEPFLECIEKLERLRRPPAAADARVRRPPPSPPGLSLDKGH